MRVGADAHGSRECPRQPSELWLAVTLSEWSDQLRASDALSLGVVDLAGET
ncbi:MAG TPA: hypothetical protein VGX68_30035 [Thermoanaerobaculia bacterium]|nr:hypothetical protein [Thermoanaerobaculia bacterium]